MINYIFINNQYWQKFKLIGIYNHDNYIFDVDGRNENIPNENLRVTMDRGEGTSVSFFEIFLYFYRGCYHKYKRKLCHFKSLK
jgi:hypothetical protein